MIKIGNKEIKNYSEPFIVAEIAANHNGNVELAKKMINIAHKKGADCVKFQSWDKHSIFSKKAYEDNFFLNDDYRNRNDHTLESIVEAYSLSDEVFIELKNYCDKIGIIFASTPFSEREVNFLIDELDVEFIKIASMDLNNFPFFYFHW